MSWGDKMLLDYGITQLTNTWHVDEKTSVGFSRIYYLLEGEFFYYVNNQQFLLKPNHLYIFPSVGGYRISLAEKENNVCTYLHLDLSPLIVESLIDLDLSKDPFISSYTDTLCLAIKQTKKDFIYRLTECLSIIVEDMSECKKVSHEMSIVVDYIDKNLSDQIELSQLAELASYNTNYFIKVFKDTFGISPYQYIIRKRLYKSIQLLREKHAISYVAAAVGFADSCSFSRAFKSHFLVSPSQFFDKFPAIY